jgi:D-alanyl-D-alanine carboxypeptidase (penicillin-binding protein 5/6)
VTLPARILHTALALLCLTAGAFAANNYIIVDNQTGHILASKDRDAKVQVASLTKVATAMVVLDWAQLNKQDLSQQVEITGSALRAAGVNPVGLQEGDRLSIRDLLYCALMASDNVAATALAQHVGARLPNSQDLDPIGNFVSHMNALARTLGMKRTLFLNPSGLDSNSDGALPYSTASDMARLTRYAYSEADFPFFVSQKTRIVHIFRAGVDTPTELRNTNDLLDQDGIDGVKTGRTSKAGECVILSSERKPEVSRNGGTVYITPRRLIVVVLGSRDRFGEGSALIKQGWGLYDQWAAGGRKTKSNLAL